MGLCSDDLVRVYMSSVNVVPWQEGRLTFDARLLHVPAGEGDSWVFQVQQNADGTGGRPFHLNPLARDLVGVELLHRPGFRP